MTKNIWKLYYKLKFGKDYQDRMNRSTRFGWMVDDSTAGNLSHFYNTQGQEIRGWHRKSPSFKFDTRHPLETYYNK